MGKKLFQFFLILIFLTLFYRWTHLPPDLFPKKVVVGQWQIPTNTPVPLPPGDQPSPPPNPCYVDCNHEVCDVNTTTGQTVCTNPGKACCGYCVPNDPNWGCGGGSSQGNGEARVAIYHHAKKGWLYHEGEKSCENPEENKIPQSKANDVCYLPDEIKIFFSQNRENLGDRCKEAKDWFSKGSPYRKGKMPIAWTETSGVKIRVYAGRNYKINSVIYKNHRILDSPPPQILEESCPDGGRFYKLVARTQDDLVKGEAADLALEVDDSDYSPVGGRILDETHNPISNVSVEIYDSNINNRTIVITDSNGYFIHRWFVKKNEGFAVRPILPPGYTYSKTVDTDFDYNRTGTIPYTWQPYNQRDTYVGEATFEHQQMGNNSCADENNHGISNRCNFVLLRSYPTPTNTPTPTLYPMAVITGVLKERLDGSCFSNISSGSISLGVTPANPAGITSNCGVTPPAPGTLSSYRCTINFNNQTAQPTPAQNFTLSANAAGYLPGYWTQDNTCLGSQTTTLSINVASGNPNDYIKNKDIFFRANQPWIKLKNSAFSSNNNLVNFIPLNITAYDSDDSGLRYFIIGEAGVVTAPLIDLGTVSVSSKGWKINSNLSPILQFRPPSVFFEYVKSRKEYVNISNLANIQSNKINIISGGPTLANNNLSNAPFVLIVLGDITIDESNFNPSSLSIAILATGAINFTPNVTQANGIFIAQTINTGETENQGLKIKGNLITQSLNNQRKWEDNSKPSVFIIFDPKPYLDLLPYLSVSAYEWTELAP